MSKEVIKIENLSKQYRLGVIGTGTLSHDLNRWWHKTRGKPDPYLRLGEENKRDTPGTTGYVWALRNINFSVNQGDTLGIIGKNGAGKSTLLKILSRVTGPTTGSFKVKGRIASLLEVGTGFHQELTGRENIFVNGAILGMTKTEIKKKLDEIIEFSGIERYIDTPAKRYSSGMYVRLAFAVAAHLEAEILIADEVLAVGDAEFQKKCLGKMKDMGQAGRTVIFVSHNMAAVKQLCSQCVWINRGEIDSIGATDDIILNYTKMSGGNKENSLVDIKRKGIGEIKFSKIDVYPVNEGAVIKSGDGIKFEVYYDTLRMKEEDNYDFVIGIWNSAGTPLLMMTNMYLNQTIKLTKLSGKIIFSIDKLPLNKGTYTINLRLLKNGLEMDFIEEAYCFEVENGNYFNHNVFYPEHYQGIYTNFTISQ